ncbi:MAG: PHP domain-containing protein, partial [Desulfamplus sp.]|nr:PHP domain-containing protein [Desulfamplus sp.]
AATHNLFVTGGSDCHDISVRPPGVEGITKEEFMMLEF